MDSTQNWINNAAMQLGLTPDYTLIPDQINVNVDYNASYGLPPLIPHVGNVLIPPLSGESSSAARQALAVEYPAGPEAISEPDAVMSNDDLSQHTTSITTKKAREREYTAQCWQIFEQNKKGQESSCR
jgi:hypothetical protein